MTYLIAERCVQWRRRNITIRNPFHPEGNSLCNSASFTQHDSVHFAKKMKVLMHAMTEIKLIK